MMSQIFRRLQLLVAQGTASMVGHDKLQAKVLDGEVLGNIKRVEPYGFSHRPHADAQAYLVFPGGDRSFGIALIVGDAQYNLELKPGEVALHDDLGQKVHLTRSGIVVDGAGKPITLNNAPEVFADVPLLKCSGDIIDNAGNGGISMADMRAAYNEHGHKENGQGNITDTPDKGMN